jgi:hypothetical protein
MFKFIKNQGKGIVLGASFTLLVTAISVPVLADSYSKMINVEVNTVNILVNGNKTNSDNIVYDGRTYVQLRDLATMMGKEIYWDQATNTASVNDKGVTYTPPTVQTKPTSTVKNGYYEFKYTDATYQGNFVNDKRDGYGVCYYNNGAVYDGNWSNGKWDGYGSLNYANGDAYQGNFVNGVREDTNATFVYANGVRYEGQYSNDKQTGTGTKYYSNGVYTGEFVNGIRHGYGVYVWESNNRYEGYWSNDKRNGQGTLYYSNGTYDFGTWVDDVLVTRG